MDYKKSGAGKAGKNAPRHVDHNAKGAPGNPFGTRTAKPDLVARMKAAAKAKPKS